MRKTNFVLTFLILFTYSFSLFAQEVLEEQKEAPCTVGDGYQTVNFDKNTSYSGYFLDCHPQSGNAVVIKDGQKITGYAEAIGNDQVNLKYSEGSVSIKVVTRMIRR
jgi:hypothetical protein